MPVFVYIMHVTDGDALYVGVTNDLKRRIGTHARRKPWFAEVSYIETHSFPDRSTAERAEREVIETLLPLKNRELHADSVRYAVATARRHGWPDPESGRRFIERQELITERLAQRGGERAEMAAKRRALGF